MNLTYALSNKQPARTGENPVCERGVIVLGMKDTFYFSHDYNARNDEKVKRLIRKYKMEGYGIFWAIVEDLYNNANALHTDYEGIAFDLHTDSNTIKSIINDFDLFVIEGNEFGSSSVERRLSDRNDKSEKARQSAFKRWNKDNDANAMPTHSDSNAIKERKGKEIKEKKVNNNAGGFLLFWESYPKKVGKIDAERAWNKSKDKPETDVILKSIEDHKRSEQWIKDNGQFIPNPATFINQGRWFDEIKKPGIIRPAFQQ